MSIEVHSLPSYMMTALFSPSWAVAILLAFFSAIQGAHGDAEYIIVGDLGQYTTNGVCDASAPLAQA